MLLEHRRNPAHQDVRFQLGQLGRRGKLLDNLTARYKPELSLLVEFHGSGRQCDGRVTLVDLKDGILRGVHETLPLLCRPVIYRQPLTVPVLIMHRNRRLHSRVGAVRIAERTRETRALLK